MPSLSGDSLVEKLISLALEEDLSGGDVTSELTVDASLLGKGELIAKEPFIFCGGLLVPKVFSLMGASVLVSSLVQEGTVVSSGAVLGIIDGSVRALLGAERTLLNLLQRLSGVATHTKRFVDAARPNTILDTRKTTPGWRHLEKYAVKVGGGTNHRMSMSDRILVKNNHVDAMGGDLATTLEKIYRGKYPELEVEVEVRNARELETALRFNPNVIMLDNWRDDAIRSVVPGIRSRCPSTQIELSGGMTLERVGTFGDISPVSISVGALTTKAVNVDISLRIQPHNG